MPNTRRAVARNRLIGLAVGLALFAAGCSSALAGHGSAAGPTGRSAPEPSSLPTLAISSAVATAPAPTPSFSTPPSSTPPSSTPVATPPVTQAAEARRLTGLLEPKPAGATTWTEAWGHIINPTLSQFVHREYAPSAVAFAESELKAQGLLAIAHRTWIAADNNQADIVLLGFKTTAGATSRWKAATAAKAAATGVRQLRIRGAGSNVRAYYTPELDDQGYVRTIVYAHRGSVVAETFAYTPSRLKPPDIIAWSQRQLSRLPA